MSNLKLKGNNTGVLIGLIVTIFLLLGGGGYLIWRVNQKDTLAPTDSDASDSTLECINDGADCDARTYPKVDGNCTDESTAGICQYPNENYCCRYTTIITAYYITYSAGSGGTVTNSGQNNVVPGGSISSTATPNSGYRFVKWSDNKTTASRTDSNVSADATYTATFEAVASQTYTLSYSVTPYTTGGVVGGTLTGNLNQTVVQGQDGTAVTFVGNDGSYCMGSILEWLVNGVKDTTVTGNTRQEKNVQANMNIEGKAGFVWSTNSTTFRYYTGANGQIKLGNGAPSVSPITLTFTNGQPCPGNISITAIPSSGYIFSHWNDTVLNARDTSSLVTANPRKDIISVTSSYKPNISVTAIFVPSSGCGDGICSDDESITTCPSDCPVRCGDGVCSEGESLTTCPSDCPANCGDGICSDGESSENCPKDCGSTVPQTGIFDDSKTAIVAGILFVIIGISWTSIFTYSQKALFIVSSTSNRIKEERFKEIMIKRRKKLERKLSRNK